MSDDTTHKQAPDQPDSTSNNTNPAHPLTDDVFSNEFALSDFERLKARIDPTTGQLEDVPETKSTKAEDIGRIWRDLKSLNHIEQLRERAQETYIRSLPVWRRGVFLAKSFFTREHTDHQERPGQPDSGTNLTAPIESRTDSVVPPKHTTIEINLSLPDVSKTLKRPTIPSREDIRTHLDQLWLHIPRRVWIIGGSTIAGIVMVILGIHVVNASVIKDPTISETPGVSSEKDKLPKGTPTFNTLLPAGKTAADVGGWTRISPPDRDAVWAYADKIGNVSISVSQQPLPKSLKIDTEERIADLATNYNASEKIRAADTTVYIGRSSDGAESVILVREKLLILIKSNGTISRDQWTSYINSLQLQ